MSSMKMGLLASTLLLLPASAFAQDSFSNDDDVVIATASPLERSIDEAITGQSVLTGEELQERVAATIGETLKYEPGLSSTSFGAGASRPIIRGQGGERIRVLTNGVGTIDASAASPDHAVTAEPAQAERIEVVRGAGLLRYGSSGSGGVVNVIDGRIPNSLPEGGTDVSLRLGASSVDLGREVAASIDQQLGNFVLHLDGTLREADNFRIPVEGESKVLLAEEGEEVPEDFDESRRLDNSFAESDSVSAGLSYVGERGFFGVAVQSFNSTYGLPGGHAHEEGEEHDHEDEEDEDHEDEEHEHEEGEEEEEENVFIDLEQTRVDVNGAVEMDGAFERLQVFAGYSDYTHTEFEGPGEVGTVYDNEGYEIRAEAIQAERGNWRAAYGVQYRDRDFSAIGAEAFIPPTTTQQLGVFTFQEIDFGETHLEGAVRFENTDQENAVDGTSRSFDLLSASVGGDLHLSDAIRIGGTVFRTERAPATEELFSNGPHLATNQFEIGDPDLGKETATGVEASIRHRENGHNLTLNLFYTDYDDFIYEIQTGEEEDGLPVFQFIGENAEFYGLEATGQTELTTVGAFNLSADALVEYVRAKAESGNVPRIPPLSVLTGLEAESERFKLRGEWEYVAEQDKLADLELPTEDYNLFNAFLTWKAPMDAQDVALRLSVHNIFDTEARQHASFLKDLVPQPGRNVRFSISAKL